MSKSNLRPESLAVHAGWHSDPQTGAVMPPIYQVSTYAQPLPGEHKGYEYSRTDNPTRTPLQKALAVLEKAEHSLVFASGMAAVDAVLMTLKPGDHIIAANDLYGGTYRLFTRIYQEKGLRFTFVDLTDLDALEAALATPTALVWLETPSNPTMRVIDIQAASDLAHAKGAKVVVDNTFMSPYFQNPLTLGADIVMHSMTKYINGHSDVVMGCLCLNDSEWYARLKFIQNSVGAVPSPFDCFLVLRGIRTLAVRMQAHGHGAMAVAQWLDQQPWVKRVLYPGLPSHPGHEIAAKQGTGFGGMMSFLLNGDLEQARRFLGAVQMFKLAESLGGVESLIEHPAIMTHASIPKETREAVGVTDDLIRLSVGIEHPADLIEDLQHAYVSSV